MKQIDLRSSVPSSMWGMVREFHHRVISRLTARSEKIDAERRQHQLLSNVTTALDLGEKQDPPLTKPNKLFEPTTLQTRTIGKEQKSAKDRNRSWILEGLNGSKSV